MKILFIEDDDEKRKKISEFLEEKYIHINIINKKSYNSGLMELVKLNEYDLILMDMSMPTFDITLDDQEGGTPENFAGRNLLEQMKFRYIQYPTIIITQFDSFGEHVDKLSLIELKDELKEQFAPIYKNTIYYHSAESDWKDKLEYEINKIKEENNK